MYIYLVDTVYSVAQLKQWAIDNLFSSSFSQFSIDLIHHIYPALRYLFLHSLFSSSLSNTIKLSRYTCQIKQRVQ
jgi:hypothetical protein